jgi:hypothetical protein
MVASQMVNKQNSKKKKDIVSLLLCKIFVKKKLTDSHLIFLKSSKLLKIFNLY